METAFITDKGKVRELNEDSCFVTADEKTAIAAVADGMGGHNAGEIASLCAVEGVKEFINENNIFDDPRIKLSSLIEKINKDIYKKAVTTRGLIGMGTTLTVAAISENKVYVAHVGDTRAYILNDSLTQLTLDHSYVEELCQMGRITKEEARVHPGRNQLTRAVGTEDEVKIDTYVSDVNEGDILLLTSDGLTNMLDDERIAEILKESPNLSSAMEELVYEANENGGFDNISAVAIRC